jgi:hypothetical protein
MLTRNTALIIGLTLSFCTGFGQTAVTTAGGSASSFPVFTGNAAVGNSVMTQANQSITWGTVTQNGLSEVEMSAVNPYLFLNGTYSALPNTVLFGIRSAGEAVIDSNLNNTSIPNWEIKLGGGTYGPYPNDAFYIARAPAANGTLAYSILVNSAGNVGIGTTSPGAKLELNGNLKLTSGSGASITFADGTQQTTSWTGVLCGGDYAEAVEAAESRAKYEPGDVLVISTNESKDVEKASAPYSTSVAGIYATKPGVIGKRESLAKVSDDLPMAMVGIVPTKVSAENGPIHRGDLLVTSSKPGYAMKGTDRNRMLGAVIGKAMGSLEGGLGTIQVLVTLQ